MVLNIDMMDSHQILVDASDFGNESDLASEEIRAIDDELKTYTAKMARAGKREIQISEEMEILSAR